MSTAALSLQPHTCSLWRGEGLASKSSLLVTLLVPGAASSDSDSSSIHGIPSCHNNTAEPGLHLTAFEFKKKLCNSPEKPSLTRKAVWVTELTILQDLGKRIFTPSTMDAGEHKIK